LSKPPEAGVTTPASSRSVTTAVGIAAERRTLAAQGRGHEVARARAAARQFALASRRAAA
jgi:hypothetical protein